MREWLTAIDAVRPGNLAGDDLTAVLLRATGGPTHGRLIARLTGVGRTLLSPFRSGPTAWPEFTVRNFGGSVLPFLSRFGKSGQWTVVTSKCAIGWPVFCSISTTVHRYAFQSSLTSWRLGISTHTTRVAGVIRPMSSFTSPRSGRCRLGRTAQR